MNRNLWGDMKVIKSKEVKFLKVIVGGEDPDEMLADEYRSREIAKEEAKEKGYYHLFHVEDRVRVYGQNELTERWYYFSKRPPE